jgi:hypothetical protein
VSGGASSTGTGLASFVVAANPGQTARQGSVSVSFASGGGQNINVSQVAPVVDSSGPSITTVLQLQPAQNPTVTNVTEVTNQQRPNAGTGPVLGPAQVSSNAGTVQVQLNAINGQPFNTVIIASDDSSSYLVVDLTPATTSASLSISVPPNLPVLAQFAAAMDGALPGNYIDVTLQSAPPPPPPGPAIQDLVRVRTQPLVASQQLINAPPPSPRPNASGCVGCPLLGPALVTPGGLAATAVRNVASAIEGPTNTVTVRLATTNGVPFNMIIVTAGNLVGGTPQAPSYMAIQLASPTASMSLELDVAAGTTFTAHFAVTTNSEPPSNYVPAVFGTCSYTVAGPTSSLSSSAGTFDVAVTTTAGCSWTASSLSPSFITVVNGSGTSSGTARFSITANLLSTARPGTVRVAGQDVTVTQVARGANP